MGEADATLLALAGLQRLGSPDEAKSVLEADAWLPAIGQGTIAITARADDEAALARLAAIDHGPTATALTAERAYLAVLDGSCRTPIGGLARLAGDAIEFNGIIVKPDGSEAHRVKRSGRGRRCGADRQGGRRRARRPRRSRILLRSLRCGSSSPGRSRTPNDTAAALAALGHSVLVEPMTRIVFLPPAAIAFRPAAIVFTSRNAVRAVVGLAAGAPSGEIRTVFAVGEQTGQAAREAGFTDVRVGGGDVARLADTIAGALDPAGGTILYVAGRDRAGDLEARLGARGFDVVTAEAYAAAAIAELTRRRASGARHGRD